VLQSDSSCSGNDEGPEREELESVIDRLRPSAPPITRARRNKPKEGRARAETV